MIEPKTPHCSICNVDFPDWESVAIDCFKHKTTHRRYLKWAAKVLAGKPTRPEIKRIARTPDEEHTELYSENMERAVIQLSGDNLYVNTVCPKCRRPHRELLPVEFAESRLSWKIHSTVAVLCQNCSGR